jgi:glycosyltransferase involved in cell wall biosynthesis
MSGRNLAPSAKECNMPPHDALIIAPSLGRRFSGINATMEALIPVMRRTVPIACFGRHLSERMPTTGLMRWLRSSQRARWRIWHARRNTDMLLGLLLRYVLRQKLILLWTSAAQRRHQWLTRFCYHRMDAVVATTHRAARFLDRPAEVSEHGVDASVYRPPGDRRPIRAALKLDDCPTIGVFGRIRPQKGTGDLVEALIQVLADFPRWRIMLIGHAAGEYIAYRERLQVKLRARGLADRVRFVGFIDNFADIPAWYQAMDVVACVSRVEGFGITCLEAMASGCPVLATHAGAWPDIITEGQDGWLAQANDPDDLARALRNVLATPIDDIHRMGQAARARVLDRFTIEHECQRLINVYRRLFRQFGEPDAMGHEDSRTGL